MADLATIYREEGRYAEAEPLSVKILEVRLRTLGPSPEYADDRPPPCGPSTLRQGSPARILLGRYGDAERLIQSYQNEYLIIGDIEVTISVAQQLVGMEKCLLDMATGVEYVEPLLRACTEFQTAIGLRLIDAGVDALVQVTISEDRKACYFLLPCCAE